MLNLGNKVQAGVILFLLSAPPVLGVAHAQESGTSLGFPNTATQTHTSIVGFPTSNQWEQERLKSFLYLSLNSGQMASPQIAVGDYVSQYDGANFNFVSLDYFTHFFSFAELNSNSSARDFSLWGRYSVGFADRAGSLVSASPDINTSIESVNLLMLCARIGLLVHYDHFSWFKPFLGVELDPYFFRQTSDLSGAEEQGSAFSWGPTLGVHLPVLFDHRVSFETELRRSFALNVSGQLLSTTFTMTAGMGVSF